MSLSILVCQSGDSSSTSRLSSAPPPSLQSASPRGLSVSPSSSCQSPGVDWLDTYQVPWDKFPEEWIQALERGKQPSPCLRREMVRIVVSDMMQRNSPVSKKKLTDIAKKMVAKYSKSLQDIIDGDVIGPVVKQLPNRIEHVKRSTTPKIRKRKTCTEVYDTDEVPLQQRMQNFCPLERP